MEFAFDDIIGKSVMIGNHGLVGLDVLSSHVMQLPGASLGFAEAAVL
jgi:hypothetical protein